MRKFEKNIWTQEKSNSKGMEKTTQREPYKPHNLYSSSSIISVIILRKMSKHEEQLELHTKFYPENPKELHSE